MAISHDDSLLVLLRVRGALQLIYWRALRGAGLRRDWDPRTLCPAAESRSCLRRLGTPIHSLPDRVGCRAGAGFRASHRRMQGGGGFGTVDARRIIRERMKGRRGEMILFSPI
ncbi:hypothetical protein CDAR_110001 [Caerostris darwini]|uniref:Ribosomal protein S14 n=1 Tax=Caerostris darwini TaxID=1538125 RepID=A0AAV4P105_9ARAC|nr:hypothetical protein CDAR_110001 [Caerostris darwini]